MNKPKRDTIITISFSVPNDVLHDIERIRSVITDRIEQILLEVSADVGLSYRIEVGGDTMFSLIFRGYNDKTEPTT